MKLLHAASKFVKDRRILTQFYFTHIRCRLEQSAMLWLCDFAAKKNNQYRTLYLMKSLLTFNNFAAKDNKFAAICLRIRSCC